MLERERTARSAEIGELVFSREVPSAASVFDCLRLVWQEAQLDARGAYEDWCGLGGQDAYLVYRAAQDRADAAQDGLATARSAHSELVPKVG
jgi:hypothetical protein